MKQLINIGFAIFLLVSCKGTESETPKPNPCSTKTATSAEFGVYESFYEDTDSTIGYFKDWNYYSSDTLKSRFVSFIAKDATASSYLWTIGGGNYKGRGVKISFYDTSVFKIPVTLQVTKKVDTTCFPNDKGFAKSSRTVYNSVGNGIKSLFDGAKFVGYLNNNPNNTVLLTFKFNIDLYDEILSISNLIPNHTHKFLVDPSIAFYRQISLGGYYNSSIYYIEFQSSLYIDKKDSLIIKYKVDIQDTLQPFNSPKRVLKSDIYLFKGKLIR